MLFRVLRPFQIWTFCKYPTSQHALGHAFVQMKGWKLGLWPAPLPRSLCVLQSFFGQVVFTDCPELKEQLCSHKDRKYRPVWEGLGCSCLGDLSVGLNVLSV